MLSFRPAAAISLLVTEDVADKVMDKVKVSIWTELDVGLWRVEGEGWNSELEPGAETAFGYCALR